MLIEELERLRDMEKKINGENSNSDSNEQKGAKLNLNIEGETH